MLNDRMLNDLSLIFASGSGGHFVSPCLHLWSPIEVIIKHLGSDEAVITMAD